ncbi:MAG TPA: hypothetical protein VGM98_09180 [Schlesneria sp.]|jgi:hypothetical protein
MHAEPRRFDLFSYLLDQMKYQEFDAIKEGPSRNPRMRWMQYRLNKQTHLVYFCNPDKPSQLEQFEAALTQSDHAHYVDVAPGATQPEIKWGTLLAFFKKAPKA